MAALKAEVLAHRHEIHGVSLRERLFGNVRTLNRIGSLLAPVSNLARTRPMRSILERVAGIDRRRPLPEYHRVTLQRWFSRRDRQRTGATVAARKARGEVVLLADSFTSYSEPHIGQAAVELLEKAGYHVRLEGNLCCGRAFISKGLLADATAHLTALAGRLAPFAAAGTPIVGLEPSCVFTLRDELPSLLRGRQGSAEIARHAQLVDQLLVGAIDDGALRVPSIEPGGQDILFHPHCHQKAALATAASVSLLERIPGARVAVLDAGCCGMAGSFGFEREHYELSMTIGGQRLFPAVRAKPDAVLAATGVSCRQQIRHGTGRTAMHPVQILHRTIMAEASTR